MRLVDFVSIQMINCGFRDIGKSEADRPDSGFDSKDGEEEDVSREEAKEEGSPEVKLKHAPTNGPRI